MPFTLTKAAATASAPAGTSGAVPPSAKTYRLDGAASVISPHVGHKVEITGSVEDQKTATAASAVSAPRLKVDSLKMVSTTCQ